MSNENYEEHSIYIRDNRQREVFIYELQKMDTVFDIEESETGEVFWKQKE